MRTKNPQGMTEQYGDGMVGLSHCIYRLTHLFPQGLIAKFFGDKTDAHSVV
jgi:hypothetical protein